MDKKFKVIDIAIIALFTAILFIQEEALSFLPNIQFTVFLIVLYSKKFGLLRTSIIVIIHTLLDNLVMGSFNFIWMPFMLIGWLIIPITLTTIFKKVEKPFALALLAVLYSFIYSWLFIIPNVLITKVDLLAYFIADIPFEIILASSSFISVLWLYKPCSIAIDTIRE